MKKKGLAILIAAMSLSLIGCQSDKDNTTKEDNTSLEDAQNGDITEQSDGTEQDGESVDAGIGETLKGDFISQVEDDSDKAVQAIADDLLKNEIIPFQGMSMPVEEGLLTGFGNTEIKGFKEGVSFAPMIGSIPFMGYIFLLEDSSKGDEFVTTLLENADKRWNVCTEADETITAQQGNKVFFLMCPSSFEEESENIEE